MDTPEWHTCVTLSRLHGTTSYRTVRTFDPGQDASLFAERTLERASHVYLQYCQRKDCYYCLLVHVLVDIPDLGHGIDLAVLLLENGLTFFYPYAAPVWEYYNAWISTQEAKKGLFYLPKEALETLLFFHGTLGKSPLQLTGNLSEIRVMSRLLEVLSFSRLTSNVS